MKKNPVGKRDHGRTRSSCVSDKPKFRLVAIDPDRLEAERCYAVVALDAKAESVVRSRWRRLITDRLLYGGNAKEYSLISRYGLFVVRYEPVSINGLFMFYMSFTQY